MNLQCAKITQLLNLDPFARKLGIPRDLGNASKELTELDITRLEYELSIDQLKKSQGEGIRTDQAIQIEQNDQSLLHTEIKLRNSQIERLQSSLREQITFTHEAKKKIQNVENRQTDMTLKLAESKCFGKVLFSRKPIVSQTVEELRNMLLLNYQTAQTKYQRKIATFQRQKSLNWGVSEIVSKIEDKQILSEAAENITRSELQDLAKFITEQRLQKN